MSEFPLTNIGIGGHSRFRTNSGHGTPNVVHQRRIAVHIEVEIHHRCSLPHTEIEQVVLRLLLHKCNTFNNGSLTHLLQEPETAALCGKIVKSLVISDINLATPISFWQADLMLHLFRLCDHSPESDFLEADGGGQDQSLPVAEQWELPNTQLQGLWESIILEETTKSRLLSYCATSLQFSERRVNSNIISWNKMILLYGPPGTGKTSLCKALAQKIYIRHCNPTATISTASLHDMISIGPDGNMSLDFDMSTAPINHPTKRKQMVRYRSGLMFEVNCHSLFSKWFSESGKLVMKLFNHISEIAEDETCLTILLIDEVESIASARSSASSSGEPGDAIRVVNAVLTSLDSLKRKPNVLVMCTSNMISSLDEAFLDRLDLKIFLGNPNLEARYQIIYSCMKELLDCELILPDETFNEQYPSSIPPNAIELSRLPELSNVPLSGIKISFGDDLQGLPRGDVLVDNLLLLVAIRAENMSGRTLRKLPVRAHSMFIQREAVASREYLVAMLCAMETNAGPF